jgi:hypothetical protein
MLHVIDKVTPTALGTLWEGLQAHQQQSRPAHIPRRILECDGPWVQSWLTRDMFWQLGLHDDDAILEAFDIPHPIVHVLSSDRRSGGGGHGVALADLTRLLIRLQWIGFNVDPTPLVDKLRPQILQRKRAGLVNSELDIVWFGKFRPPREIWLTSPLRPEDSGESIITATGQRIILIAIVMVRRPSWFHSRRRSQENPPSRHLRSPLMRDDIAELEARP